MVIFKQLVSSFTKQQADFEKKLKSLTKLNNADLTRENENLKKKKL